MTKKEILKAIKNVANSKGKLDVGVKTFCKQYDITEYMINKYWLKWSDAVKEAGIKPNTMKVEKYTDEELLSKLIEFIREIGKYPTDAEIKMKYYKYQKSFPYYQLFYKRFGRKSELMERLLIYCKGKKELSDIQTICRKEYKIIAPQNKIVKTDEKYNYGFIYMMKSGKYYKVGLSCDVERRKKEIGLKLPEEPKLIHKIETDDTFGIEKYWHRRFVEKRKNGEWFLLSKEDVKAFKSRRTM
ncbi:MAG: GIY-YIG nuclease family protein [Ignavibacteria bacterium]|nr:GIY-YIG nuclease family protein [Ignavibacteria bacterium]MCU7511075.1 GIY-YIG nuclease family protein [Ignavibacteria bacterium]MCU7518622.1 GIY-YIG nuclease family protein [Ignavibacteria bacterium]